MTWRDGIGFGDPKKRRTVEESGGDTALLVGRMIATGVFLLGLVVDTTWVRVLVLIAGGAGFAVTLAALRSRRPTVKRTVAYSAMGACLAAAGLAYLVDIY